MDVVIAGDIRIILSYISPMATPSAIIIPTILIGAITGYGSINNN